MRPRNRQNFVPGGGFRNLPNNAIPRRQRAVPYLDRSTGTDNEGCMEASMNDYDYTRELRNASKITG